MRSVLVPTLVFASICVGQVRADTALPIKTLNEIKSATVFVRVEKEKIIDASGSGFLIRVDGDTGYVVTNHHVVNLTVTVERKVAVLVPAQPTAPRTSPGRPPVGPRPITPKGPIVGRPTTEYRIEKVEVAVPAPNITLVFNSGAKQERIYPAEVVASDPVLDIAILKIKGATDLPKPIDINPPEIHETMTVFIFGFPFGKGLSIDKNNPAVTVNKAAVSSIRAADDGNVRTIQLDGSVNPGNSGGPVVDENGRLTGITVAKIRNTNIGLAIPAEDLHRVLAGYAARAKLIPAKAEQGAVEIQVEADVVDPYEKLKSVFLYYAPTSAVSEAAKKDGLGKVAEAKKIELKREKLKATGLITLEVPADKVPADLTCQLAYVNASGKLLGGMVRTLPLQSQTAKTEPAKPNPPKVEAKPMKPAPEAPAASAPLPIIKFDGDRGVLVGVTLKPLNQAKPLTANELSVVIDDLQIPAKAHGAVKRLTNAEPDPKRRAEVARLLEKVATSNDAVVFARAEAATALRRWGTEESVAILTALVSDPSPHSIHFRSPALWSLGYLGGDKAIAAIATRIDNAFDHGTVVQVLQGMGSAAEAQALVSLDHQKDGVRLDAAKILKSVGTKASASALTKAAEGDKNESVRKEAAAALTAIAERQMKK